MRKIIYGISLLILTFFSFFYTDKVINIINKKDPLMDKIVSVKDSYNVIPVDGMIKENTIIPGIYGREVDTEKSYNNMKLGGVFREEALVFKDLSPDNLLINNKNKFIVKGNSTKKEVAILFVFNNNYKDSLKKYNDITIFFDHNDLNIANINFFKDNEIYTYGDHGIYNHEILVSDNALINRISKNKSIYCLVKEKNEDILNICNDNDMYIVLPNIIGDYYEVKEKISNGSIILLNNLKDIDIIIRYIESKGYDIVSLNNLLNE